MKAAVIGVGQSLKGDDAIGLAAVQRWQQCYPQTASRPEVIVEITELPGLSLLDILNGLDAAILVDAVQSDSPVGTIHRLDIDQLLAFSDTARTVHGWGLAETLSMARKLDLPAAGITLKIIGVEVRQMEMGSGLSMEVERVIPILCGVIEETLQALLS